MTGGTVTNHRTPALFAIGLVLYALIGVERLVAGEEGGSEQEALSLLTEYLRIDTTNPPGNEIKAAEYFKAIFDREGIEAHVFESAPDEEISTHGSKGMARRRPSFS